MNLIDFYNSRNKIYYDQLEVGDKVKFICQELNIRNDCTYVKNIECEYNFSSSSQSMETINIDISNMPNMFNINDYSYSMRYRFQLSNQYGKILKHRYNTRVNVLIYRGQYFLLFENYLIAN